MNPHGKPPFSPPGSVVRTPQDVAPSAVDPRCMLIVHAGFDEPFVATLDASFYAREDAEPERSIARHLYQGGTVEVLSLTPKWADADELAQALRAALQGERTLDSLGTLTPECTYTNLRAYFDDQH